MWVPSQSSPSPSKPARCSAIGFRVQDSVVPHMAPLSPTGTARAQRRKARDNLKQQDKQPLPSLQPDHSEAMDSPSSINHSSPSNKTEQKSTRYRVGASSSGLESSSLPQVGSSIRRRGTVDPTSTSSNTSRLKEKMEVATPRTRPSWLILALASGCFAALNGVFAKLYVSKL